MERFGCDCAELIEDWWEEDEDGKPRLYIDDSAVPSECSHRQQSNATLVESGR